MSIERLVSCVASVIVLMLCLIPVAYAQHFSVAGAITDSTDVAIPQATVVVLAHADSALIQFGTTDDAGTFSIGRLPAGAYVLRVSSVGYQTVRQKFDIVSADVDMGQIMLGVQTQELEEFVIEADRLPYVVRGDTVEYNVLAFIVRPQDMVEDLLRRLPGLDVDRYGTIFAQGKVVEHVLVEGKEFFSSDHTIATRNLPADAVEKVQVYDKASDRSELTGIPDGREEKTVDLKLTKEAKRGAFGHTTGGLGAENWSQGRYFGQLSAFRFAPETQLALIGNAENVNQPGFSFDQLQSFRGAGRITSPDDGISKSLGLGFHANRDFGDDTRVNLSYFLTDHANAQESVLLRKELLDADVAASSDESNNRRTDNLAHSTVLQANIKLSEGHDLRFKGTLSKVLQSLNRTGLEHTMDLSRALSSIALHNKNNEEDAVNADARLVWRKRLSSKGHSLIATSTVNANNSDEATRLGTETQLSTLGDIQTREELNQEQEFEGSSLQYGHRLEFLQPLLRGRILTLYVNRTATNRRENKSYFDIIDGTSIRNASLSERFKQHYEYWRSGAEFTLQAADRSWYVAGTMEVRHSRRRGMIRDLSRTIRSRLTHVLPGLLAQIDLAEQHGLDLRYAARIHEPSLRQLQPFTDNSNPLRIYVGNPALTPEYEHQAGVRYHFFQSYSGFNLFVGLGGKYINNSIIYERTVDAQLRQTLRAINAGDVWSIDSDISFGKPIRSLSMNWELDSDVDLERGTEMVNGAENDTRVLRNRLRLEITHYGGDKIDLTATGEVTYNRIRYSLNEELNRNYTNGTVDAEMIWSPSEKWSFESSLLYRIFDRTLFGSNQDIAMLNLSMSRSLLKGRGNIEFELNDTLNKSRNVSISSGANYIQESRIALLGRYAMLKLTYKPRLM